MDSAPKKTLRKLVTLPAELAERVELFRVAINASSESDALKTLIEDGLKARDTREDLFARCKTSTTNNQGGIAEVINLTSNHPLVARTIVAKDSLEVALNSASDEADERFRFSRIRRTWCWERSTGFSDEWREVNIEPAWDASPDSGARSKAKAKNDLDDDIPF